MTDAPDFRGQVEQNKPTDIFHRIAGMIPGYSGYQDLERRREADKLLRTWLGRQYRDQLHRLTRLEQTMARGRATSTLPELQRLDGMLNRFIDKLETATYGYSGLFDEVKVTGPELDQLYTFDQGLVNGVGAIDTALDAVEAAGGEGAAPAGSTTQHSDLSGALDRLGTVLDDLLHTWNHRSDVLTSGQALPPAEYERARAHLPEGAATSRLDPGQVPPTGGSSSAGSSGGYGGSTGGSGAGASGGYGGSTGGSSSGVGSSGSHPSSGSSVGGYTPAPGPGTGAQQYSGSGTPSGLGAQPGPGPNAATGSSVPATNVPDPNAERASYPGEAARGGSLGGDTTTAQPLVGGGESAGSTAPYAGADPANTRRFGSGDDQPVGPETDDGTHSTHGDDRRDG
jgi:hypothetical protein